LIHFIREGLIRTDLKEYEAWFVPGSQHLYGDEVLKTVADHSQKKADMALLLNDFVTGNE
jgi:L-arabinose isomerase